jgi:predicted transcriptional regulator
MMKNLKANKATESEMEILKILWEHGPSTVREVHDFLSQNKESGYTTTLKLMQIMLEKGLLTRNDTNRTHVYSSNVKQELIQKQLVGKIINGMFKGSSAQLIMHALGNHRASKEELIEIKKYLDDIVKQDNLKPKVNSKK